MDLSSCFWEFVRVACIHGVSDELKMTEMFAKVHTSVTHQLPLQLSYETLCPRDFLAYMVVPVGVVFKPHCIEFHDINVLFSAVPEILLFANDAARLDQVLECHRHIREAIEIEELLTGLEI